MGLVTLGDVRAAAARIAGIAVRTPLLPATWAGDDFWLKPESLQPTGAFKLRGAAYAVNQLRSARGVVTHSSGNHGQALAYAARETGMACLVVMPDAAPPHKIEAVRRLGAEVVLVPPAERESAATRLAVGRDFAIVPPFDHHDVIAGQGTVGLEIAEDLPDVSAVLVPVGGGGLASGVATAVKALCPRARVIGVEPEVAPDARDSWQAGELRPLPPEVSYRTVADGLRTALSPLTLEHLRARLDDIVLVSEAEILAASQRLLRHARLVAEPSGAVATAAYVYRRGDLPPGPVVAVVSGGNVDPELLPRLAAGVAGDVLE